jgi:hypothetical protein
MEPKDIVFAVIDSQGERSPEPSEALAERILTALAKAGFEVLDSCHRCGVDASEHWCADLEETFN